MSRRHRINCSSHGTQKELGSISRRDSVCRRLLQTWGRFNASDRGSRNAADCAFRAGAVERRSVGSGRQIGPDAQGATKSLVLLIVALPDRVATHMDSGAMSRLSALATATPVDPYAVAGRIEQRRESGDRPCPARLPRTPSRRNVRRVPPSLSRVERLRDGARRMRDAAGRIGHHAEAGIGADRAAARRQRWRACPAHGEGCHHRPRSCQEGLPSRPIPLMPCRGLPWSFRPADAGLFAVGAAAPPGSAAAASVASITARSVVVTSVEHCRV